MSRFAQQFRKSAGECGTLLIEETGLCFSTDVSAIEANCTRRYRMEPLPNAAGAVMKILDGTSPLVTEVSPLTDGQRYRCVKIWGQCDPYAPVQDGGPYAGKAILFYTIRYQQVGGIA